MRKTSVLLMARELGLGGSERQLTEIALGLDGSLFEPYVGTFFPDGIRGDELRAAGVPVIHFPVPAFRSMAAIVEARNLASFIRRPGIDVEPCIDVVHAFDAPASVFATPVTRYFTSAVLLTSQRGHRGLTPEYRKWLRWTDRRVDGIVVNCAYLKRHLVNDEQVPDSLIHLCPNGIDLERFRFAPAIRPPGIPEGAFVIGAVAALRPEKDLSTLIRAFALICGDEIRGDVTRGDVIRGERLSIKLVIVGGGRELETLQQCARAAGVAEDCIWQPPTADVSIWLRSFDIFVLTSRIEAFPNSVMEAMACRCAVVVSNVGGVPELVREGATGLLFEPGDPAALAEKLRCLMTNAPLRRSLAEAGERFVRQNLSRQAAARKMAQIYHEQVRLKHGNRH